MDNVHGAHGFNGYRPVCLDIFQGVSGQCPHFPLRESPWIMSRGSMDILQGDGGQFSLRGQRGQFSLRGQCPLSPWKLSSLSGLMDFV